MDFDQIRCFVAAVREPTFMDAAAALHITQSSLSKQIRKLEDAIQVKGLTLVPIKLYFKNNILKVSLGVCRGKKDYDKRESIKERDMKREILKDIKKYN